MTGAAPVPLRFVAKEIRALSLPFVACLAAMAAAVAGRQFAEFDIPAYILGAAALGALSIGHEYSHRTVALLLSQPVPRQRLLLVKLGVLAATLVALWVAGNLLLFRGERVTESVRLGFTLLPLVGGLCVAPWLTMLCRSPIAGTVFTVGLPGVLLTVSQLLYVAAYGRVPPTEFELAVVWRGTLTCCAVGAIMTWRLFMRLEAIDGPGPNVHLPHWLRWRAAESVMAPALTRPHPIWLLVKKELRLQQMAFAVVGVSVLGWFTLVSSLRVTRIDDVFIALAFVGGALIAMLIGSLASADERQLGTLEWQLLLPVATWKQWTVKVATTLGLALLLSLGVPALLAAITPGLSMPRGRPQLQLAGVVTLLTVSSLYVSSLSTSGLRALLVSLPVIVGAAWSMPSF